MRVGSLAQPGRLTRPFVRWLGPHAYLLATGVRLASPRRTVQRVVVGGDGPQGRWQWEGECHALFVANQPTLGAGLALPVEASASDGVCEVCLVPRRSRLSLATKLAALRTGRPQPDDVLTVRRATRVTIEAERVVPFAGDGDVLCIERRFQVTVCPGALSIVC
jgi:diacylglycerol kinase family enzyme